MRLPRAALAAGVLMLAFGGAGCPCLNSAVNSSPMVLMIWRQ
jgi:hypothetical protein